MWNKFRFPYENKKKLPLFIDSNQNVAYGLPLYVKKTMVDPKFLKEMFHYFYDKVIPNLMKLINSPSLTKHNDLASLLDYEEISEAKITPATRKISLSSKILMVQ